MKITAYDDNGKKIGTTKTESFFTIEGVRITFPNEGDVCVGGNLYYNMDQVRICSCSVCKDFLQPQKRRFMERNS